MLKDTLGRSLDYLYGNDLKKKKKKKLVLITSSKVGETSRE